MPKRDGTGPNGTGPKKNNRGVPKRDGTGRGNRRGNRNK